MKSIWTVGEALCEIMRVDTDAGLDTPELFKGPFPSGAPAIFIDTAAKLGTPSGLIGTVGDDAFGACIRRRLLADGADCSLLATNTMLSTAVPSSPIPAAAIARVCSTSATPLPGIFIIRRTCRRMWAFSM